MAFSWSFPVSREKGNWGPEKKDKSTSLAWPSRGPGAPDLSGCPNQARVLTAPETSELTPVPVQLQQRRAASQRERKRSSLHPSPQQTPHCGHDRLVATSEVRWQLHGVKTTLENT